MISVESPVMQKKVQTNLLCPACGRKVRALVEDYAALASGCTHCVDQLESALLKSNGFVPEAITSRVGENLIVFPTPLRLNADSRFTGKGVTVCIIDSGFYPHPDLVRPRNRILAAVDIPAGETASDLSASPTDDEWHGTMTSVVCAGNGFLSNGFYAGIASEADLVLLRVKDEKGISGDNIAKAIRWAIAHKDEYNIRIINLSVTDDEPTGYKESLVDQAAEDAVRAGIVVVAAVGNDPSANVKAPANSPHVIAVGGVDDHNTLGMVNESAYHSTYGITVDQFVKPELIAPSIWLAAPILPMTTVHSEAAGLFSILAAEDRHVKAVLVKELESTNLSTTMLQESVNSIRDEVKKRIHNSKFISRDYLHADGTSFAAPVVCSIVAQMLQVHPALSPAAIRNILLTTARKLDHVPVERQGYGVINARTAVQAALEEKHIATGDYPSTPVINMHERVLTFFFHHDGATRVALAGSFNGWQPTIALHRNGNAVWKAEIPMLPAGTYLYKFVVDNKAWVNDPENLFQEPDGLNGFNSRFTIR